MELEIHIFQFIFQTGNERNNNMECFVCGKKLEGSYLCKEHSQKLKDMLKCNIGKVENPNFKHHCSICGEYLNRIIIEYPSVGYFCDKDIIEEWNKNNI